MNSLSYERMKNSWNTLKEGLLEFVYPQQCLFCHSASNTTISQKTGFCEECERQFISDTSSCQRCAATIGPFTELQGKCSLCINERYAFEETIRLGRYENSLALACKKLKHLSGSLLVAGLTKLLIDSNRAWFEQRHFDFVVPIPMHWRSFLSRQYNQSDIIAKTIASQLMIPCKNRWLKKVKWTPEQTSISPTERRKNLIKAFRASNSKSLKDQSILLVDDVLTTGSTCHQAAKALKQSGVKSVSVAVLGRGDHV